MNKKPLVALSVVGLIALVLSTGSVIAQDPVPTSNPQPSPLSREVLSPQSPEQPTAPTGTQLGTTMSYQGQLQKSGNPHNGTCNFQFSLWDAATDGAQQGGTLTKMGLTVANGLFSTELDFGNPFYGEVRWLQTAVQCTGDAGYTTLDPRQPQNAVPYAMGMFPSATIRGTHGSHMLELVNKAGAGVAGYSTGNAGNSWGVFGSSDLNAGVHGRSEKGYGVFGYSTESWALYGIGNLGVYGEARNGDGVYGKATINGNGVAGVANGGHGGHFYSQNNVGIFAESSNHDGIQGISHTAGRSGVYGSNDNPNGFAGYFVGRVRSNVLEIAGGSDLAERFEQADVTKAEPGTIMVADENNPGKLKVGISAYDTKVVGIVSGAGGINTGLTLHQEGAMTGDLVVAVAGRVYAKCEATSSPIKPGDLLTTSSIPGHCMKATDRDRRDGAVIGKAMSGLKDGKGLVLVIVNLQ